MKFMILMHPEGHVAGYTRTPFLSNLRSLRHTFESLWDDNRKLRSLASFCPAEQAQFDPLSERWREDGYREIGIYDVLDERDEAIKNAFNALFAAFDAHRDKATRDTSRYLAPFREMVDEMLRFADDPDLFDWLLDSGPLPDVTLFVGAKRPSRYDFWEALR